MPASKAEPQAYYEGTPSTIPERQSLN